MEKHIKLVVGIALIFLPAVQTLATLNEEVLRSAQRTARMRAIHHCYKEKLSSPCHKAKDTSTYKSTMIDLHNIIHKKRSKIDKESSNKKVMEMNNNLKSVILEKDNIVKKITDADKIDVKGAYQKASAAKTVEEVTALTLKADQLRDKRFSVYAKATADLKKLLQRAEKI